MKQLATILILTLCFTCNGQQRGITAAIDSAITANGGKIRFKPGQEKFLQKVICTRPLEDWGAVNDAAKVAIDGNSVNFPIEGKTYTVVRKTEGKYYVLYELDSDTMWECTGFIVVNQTKYL